MAKLTSTQLTGGFGSAAAMNANFAALDLQFNDKVLYRDNPVGEPNDMKQNLGMGLNRIINLKDSVDPQDAVTRQDLLTLIAGTRTFERVTATTSPQTVFNFLTITWTLAAKQLLLFINGIYQEPGSFTETDTNTITLSEGINTGDVMDIFVIAS